MDKIDVLTWVFGIGFIFNYIFIIAMWNSSNQKNENLDDRLSSRIDKLDAKIIDIDRRVCRLEGVLASKDYSKEQ